MSYCNILSIKNECKTTGDKNPTKYSKDIETSKSINSNKSFLSQRNRSISSSNQFLTIERPRTLSQQDPFVITSESHNEEDLIPSVRLSPEASQSIQKDNNSNITVTSLLSKLKSPSSSTINSQQAYSFVDKLDYDLIDETLLSLLDSTSLEFKEHQPSATIKLQDFNHQHDTLSEQNEEVPIYKLRADPENPSQSCDWIKGPHCFDEQQISELTSEQIKVTLDYFVLSGYRVSQMTKTYDDIEAVTKLLDEKEKDLELAATIGQQLLEKNQQLDSKIEFLEKELHETVENVNQLRYEIVLKDNLLKTFIESENESSLESQHFDVDNNHRPERGDSEALSMCKKRIIALEDENDTLRDKAEYFEREAAELETKRQILVNATSRELEHTRSILKDTQEELKIKSSEYLSQQDEIQTLYTQLVELQYRVKLLTKDNTDLQFIYDSSTSSLMNQVNELKEKYNECLALLSKTQDELLVLKSKLNFKRQQTLFATNNANDAAAVSPTGKECRPSLVVDVESSEFGANMAYSNKNSPFWGTQSSLATELLQSASNRNSEILEQAFKTSKFLKSVKRRVARQIPGTSVDAQQSDSELDTFNSEHDTQFDSSHFRPLSFSSSNNMQSSFSKFPSCRTPDSIFSTGSASIVGRSNSYLLPEKLQIVKPIEGSQTLQHWQNLAIPNLGCLFETRPGISLRETSFINSKSEQLQKERRTKNFDYVIDEEDDFGVYDEDDEDELDFRNYNDDYFNSSFAEEMMLNKKSSDSADDMLFSVDADPMTTNQLYRNRVLFSPSKVELLSKLLEKDEENGKEISKEPRNHQNSRNEHGGDQQQNVLPKTVDENEQQRTKRKKQRHDDPDTPPSSPIHFVPESSGGTSNLLYEYFESARLKCRSAFVEPFSSYFQQATRHQQEQEATSTPPGTPTVEEAEYNEQLNRYDKDAQNSEIKNFFDQIVSKLSLFSFRNVANPSTVATTVFGPAESLNSVTIIKPSPVYANTIKSNTSEISNSNQVCLNNKMETTPVTELAPLVAMHKSESDQPETPPCSPTPSDHCEDYNEEDIKKSAFVRVARLNPYINKSVDLASLLGSLSSLKRNQRLCKYY